MRNALYICIGVLVSALAFSSCDDKIDIRQDYDFSLSSWYLQKQISADETVEIRFYLDREGNYGKAEYDIGYIQVEGKGEVTDCEGVKLVNREVRPLAEMPGLDTDNPVKQVFTLLYRSTSARRSELKFLSVTISDRKGRCPYHLTLKVMQQKNSGVLLFGITAGKPAVIPFV